jgi:hypothetical protein
MNYDLRVLSLGEMIGRAFNIYFDNFVTFITVALLSNMPFFLILLLMTAGVGKDPKAAQLYTLIMPFVIIIVYLVCSYIATGIIINIISKRYLNKSVSMEKAVGESFKFMLPLVGASLLLVLIFFVGLVLLSVVLILITVNAGMKPDPRTIGIIMVAGTLTLGIPIILIYMGFSLTTQVLVVERKKIFKSLKRSWELTRGKKLRILGYSILITLMVLIPTLIAQALIAALLGMLGLTNSYVYTLISYGISSLTGPVSICFFVLLYYNIRIEKEGFALEHLAEEFSLANADNPEET